MLKRIIFFFISATILVALYGCHAGGNSPLAPNNGETVVSPETRTVGANGRFDDITFPSGAVIKCPNDSTFQEGVKVTAAEQKVPVITDNSGKFSYIYVYNISAVLPSDNTLTADVPVNTIEKPISVTLSNDSTAGTCYIGTRASESDPWRYSLATDGISSNARFMRLSSNPPKTCTFNLFRLNIEFRLFVFDNESKKDDVQVDTLTLAPAEDVEIKDGKYTGKLTVKLNLEGENLNGLKAEDLIAKITYRSENQQGANIDFTTNKTDSSDKAVTGSYEHSFEVSNIKVENTIGNTAELSFELNLDGVSLDDFPKDFLVEFYSKGSDENTRPFEYTQSFGFETKNQQGNPDNPDPDNPDPDNPTVTDYKITYDLDGGQLAEGVTNPSSYNKDSGTLVLKNPTKDGYTFLGWTGSNGDTPQTSVEITNGSTGDRSYKANWQQNAPNTYTLTLVAGTGIASVDDSKAYQADESITLNYTLIDGYQFDKWSDSEGNTVTSPFTMPAKAVTLTANAKAITYNINYNLDSGQLTKDNPSNYTVETESFTLINPTKDDYIFLGWTYEGQTTPQLEVTITKGSTTSDKTYTANWGKAVASLKSASTDFAVNGQIQIEFDKDITWQDSFKDNITITPTTPTTTITINTYSYNNKVLTLTPASNLKYNTGYTIAIAGMTKVSDKNLTFTTKALNVTPEITSASSNTVAALDGKTILQPVFTIDFGKSVVNQETAKSHILLNSSALPNFANIAFSADGKIATLTFNTNLDVATSYQLGITGFTDDDNATIITVNKTFTTITIPEDIVGNGTENSPYLIFTKTHLQKVCDNDYNGKYFKQMNNIALIGNWTASNGFYGIYDGNNYKITGLNTTSNGLFKSITGSSENKSEVKNLTLENVSISYSDYGGSYVGALAGQIYNTKITNVHVVGNINIQGSSAVGGLLGLCSDVEISCCSVVSANGVITVGNSGFDAGGLIGRFDKSGNSSIAESYASIRVEGRTCVGGLVGALQNCIVTNSYSNCTITALEMDQYNGPSCVGGLFGVVNADNAYFTKCYSKGTININVPVSKKAGDIGGLCGKILFSNPNYQNSTNSFTSMTINVSEGFTVSGYHPYNPEDERGKVPLYYSQLDINTYVYSPDETNHNYLSNGYPATGANWDGWDASIWSGLTEGAYPTLINNPPPINQN